MTVLVSSVYTEKEIINHNKMKKLIVYYFLIITPFAVLIYATKNGLINSSWFVALLFIYVLIYRTLTDYVRLRSKNIIGKNQFWKILIPGARIKYFRELYFV